MIKRKHLLGLLFIFFSIFSTSLLKASPWSLPINLSAPLSGIDHPQVILNEKNQGIAIWNEFFLFHSNETAEIVQAATFDQGKWSHPINLSESAKATYHPQIALNAKNNAVAVWVKKVSSNPQNFIIQASSLNTFSSRWRRTIDLSTSPFYDVEPSFPQVAIDENGNAIALWRAGAEIHAASLAYRSKEWSAPKKLSDTGSLADKPLIGVDKNGNFLAVWQEKSPHDTHKIQAKILLPKDLTSLPKVTLSDPNDNATNPQLSTVGDGKAAVIWEKNKSHVSIQARFLSFREKIIEEGIEIFTLSNSGINSINPDIKLNKKGVAIATWESHPEKENSQILALVYKNEKWENEEEISFKHQEHANHPRIGIDEESNAIIVWQQDDLFSFPGIHEAIYYKGHWSWPAQLSASGERAHYPQVALNSGGKALAVWSKVFFYAHSECFKVMQASFKEMKD